MDIDVRGPRFGAAVTTVVLAVVLITGSAWLLAWQTLAFALGAAGGVGRSPYGWLFRKAVRPRLGPPTEFEAPRTAAVRAGGRIRLRRAWGWSATRWGPQWLGLAATGAALAAAFLNAAFGYCLGCEMYLLVRRVTVRAE